VQTELDEQNSQQEIQQAITAYNTMHLLSLSSSCLFSLLSSFSSSYILLRHLLHVHLSFFSLRVFRFNGFMEDFDANKDGKVTKEDVLEGVEKHFIGQTLEAIPGTPHLLLHPIQIQVTVRSANKER
jgi:hypothetical protein